ncbi:MAG: hypothetical protein II575_03370 [Bacteroidales bacterium]|nr:hypothetical protein [Bacteroidales bacterium]MBQ2352099.1 hypothetical protein [Bacteroidales bacterium]MBQ2573238.1 hypothetical protein [Bacteroidales bacterium]
MLVVSNAPFFDRKFIPINIGNMQIQVMPETIMFVAIDRIYIPKSISALIVKASIVFINIMVRRKQNVAKRNGFI